MKPHPSFYLMQQLSARVERQERDTEHSPPCNVLHLIIRMSSLREHGQLYLDLTPLKYFYVPDSYHIYLKPVFYGWIYMYWRTLKNVNETQFERMYILMYAF